MKGIEGLRKTLPNLGAWLAAPMLLSLLAGIGQIQSDDAVVAVPHSSAVLRDLGASAVSNAVLPADLSAAFKLPFTEAIEFLKAKNIVTPDQFRLLDAAAKARSFSIAGLTNEYALESIKGQLQTALETGQTVNGFLDSLDARLQAAGLSPDPATGELAHLRLVYTQNLSTAYAAGRYAQMMRSAQTRPYWQYLTVGDERVRPEHAALDGIVKPADDKSFWSRYYPPWDFGCRCTVVSLDADDLAAAGLSGPTTDAEIAARYQKLLDLDEPMMVPENPGWTADPAERFFLNQGPAGLAPTEAGRAALDALLANSAANAFDPSQARDELGMWTSEGGGAVAGGAKGERTPRTFRDPAGKVVTEVPEHVAKLVIPPAWRDVQVNPDPRGDVMAKGVDAKGRVQTIYSESHVARQMAAKYVRVESLAARDPAIGDRLRGDQTEEGAALSLIRETGIRPGSSTDTKAKVQAYGATTLLGHHVVTEGENTRLRFIGKKGVALDIPVADRGVASMVRERAQRAGPDGHLFATDEARLRDFTRQVAGGDFHPKDFRTLKASREALRLVEETPPPKTEKEYRKAVMGVAKRVSGLLGNTPIVALQSYINPAVFARWRKVG